MHAFIPSKPKTATRWAFWPLLSVLLLALGCGAVPPPSGPPPIEIAIRDSVVGRDKVIRLTNVGERELQLVRLELKGEKKSFEGVIADSIRPHRTAEVGWLQLGFTIKAGMKLRVTCKDYPEAVEYTVD